MKNVLLPIGLLCCVAICFGMMHIQNMKTAPVKAKKSIVQENTITTGSELEPCSL